MVDPFRGKFFELRRSRHPVADLAGRLINPAIGLTGVGMYRGRHHGVPMAVADDFTGGAIATIGML